MAKDNCDGGKRLSTQLKNIVMAITILSALAMMIAGYCSKASKDAVASIKTRVSVVENRSDNIDKKLDKMDGKIDRLLERK
jgi:hypothetical protein